MAVIIDGLGQPVNITVAASGVVVCPVASILTGGGGGGGGVTDHGALTGLADDDHPQYLNNARGDARYSQLAHNHDHGNLTGLADDDHPQYLNNARGDIRYALINHSHGASAITVNASGFNGNLSTTDTNVQSALQKLDDLTVSVSGNLTGIDSISTPDWIQFDTAPAGADAVGRLRWNTNDNTLNLGIDTNVTLPIGQQLIQEVMNNDGTAIAKGDVVYVLGASGNRLSVAKARADAEATSSKTFGVALEAISNNQTGYVLTYGLVTGLNTNALQEGYAVWLSPSVAGGLTTTKPTGPNHGVLIGFCVRQQSVNGELFVAIKNGQELDELHNVNVSSPASGDVLGFNSVSQTWIPTQRVSTTDSRLTDARTPTAHAASHAASGTDALTLSQSQITNLTSDLSGKVPTTRTITTGTGLTGGGDLSANRTLAVSFGTTSSTVMAGNASTADFVTFTNAAYSSTATRQVVIQQDGTLTAPRIVTLPYADDLAPGSRVVVNTGAGCTTTNYVQVTARGGEFINTTLGSFQITTAFASRVLYTDGVGWWADPSTVLTRGLGGQGAGSALTEPTTATSLLTSTVTIPPCVAGDAIHINAGINLTQFSGTTKNVTFGVKLNATTLLTMTPTMSSSATLRHAHLNAVIRVVTTTTQSAVGTLVTIPSVAGATAVPFAATGTATENLGSSLALDLLLNTSAAGATQTFTLTSFSVSRIAA